MNQQPPIEAQSANVNPPSERRCEARQPQTTPRFGLPSSRITRLRHASTSIASAAEPEPEPSGAAVFKAALEPELEPILWSVGSESLKPHFYLPGPGTDSIWLELYSRLRDIRRPEPPKKLAAPQH